MTVITLVKSRLLFVPDTPESTVILNSLSLEAMWNLEPCFKVRVVTDAMGMTILDDTRVGVEANYTYPQLSLIADIVAYMALVRLSTEGLITDPTVTQNGLQKFIAKAKAGSADIEWEQYDYQKLNGGASIVSIPKLMEIMKNSALSKMKNIGCGLSLFGESLEDTCGCVPLPFVVKSFCLPDPYR
jgi:hypothetical protein